MGCIASMFEGMGMAWVWLGSLSPGGGELKLYPDGALLGSLGILSAPWAR